MRRTLIIAGILIVLVGIGTGIYFYFFASTPSVSVGPPPGGLPTAGEGGPFGTDGETAGAPASSTSAPVPVSARLVKISAGPVALGEAVINTKGANASSTPETEVRFIDRRSGNVFSYKVATGALTRISNKTVPGIESALWLPDASVAFVRYLSGTDLSTVNTYALPANGANGFFLQQNLSGIAVASTSVLTLSSGVNGSIASLSRTDGSRPSTLFTSPLSALRVSFAGRNQYLAFTKPSAALPGSAFLVDSSGRFSRIIGPKNGLVALPSPLGTWALVSSVADEELSMELVRTSTGESLRLPVATVADKCVWAADDSAVYCGIPQSPPLGRNYPDDWYQGAVSFDDRIWKIQVSGRYAQMVLDFPTETKLSLDAESLAIDPAGTVLVFVNKNDGSLWSYQL